MSNNKKNKPVALIVDDQESICHTISGVLSDEGWDSVNAYSGQDAITVFKKQPIDLVLLDVWMRGMDGIEVLQRLKEIKENIPVVIMSGHGTIETAVKATKLGAFDFLEKPLSIEKMLPMIDHAEKLRTMNLKNSFRDSNYELVGESEFVASIHRQIKVVAPRNSWILVTGENGTGKEVVARNIHLHSPRADKAFVAVNCAAIPEELIESELFGHAKGAFTNAVNAKLGKFELAHQGTLFLDEIGDMSLRTQSKILRILQEQSFERVGDVHTISVDVRVIAATNKNLQHEIYKGNFREDLFYRLNVIPIHMIPLRQRSSDIRVLVDYFFTKLSLELKENKKIISNDALAVLEGYSWPGNVRELRNLVERLSILVAGDVISLKDVSDLLQNERINDVDVKPESSVTGTLKEARNVFERSFILEKLKENEWNVSKTAEAIGVERSNLHRKLRNYSIDAHSLKPKGASS